MPARLGESLTTPETLLTGSTGKVFHASIPNSIRPSSAMTRLSLNLNRDRPQSYRLQAGDRCTHARRFSLVTVSSTPRRCGRMPLAILRSMPPRSCCSSVMSRDRHCRRHRCSASSWFSAASAQQGRHEFRPGWPWTLGVCPHGRHGIEQFFQCVRHCSRSSSDSAGSLNFSRRQASS